MKEDKPIIVCPCPELSPADEARVQLAAASAVLHVQAAEALADGMYLERQSARIEQLATIVSDEDVIQVRDTMVAEGVLVIEGVEVPPPGTLIN